MIKKTTRVLKKLGIRAAAEYARRKLDSRHAARTADYRKARVIQTKIERIEKWQKEGSKRRGKLWNELEKILTPFGMQATSHVLNQVAISQVKKKTEGKAINVVNEILKHQRRERTGNEEISMPEEYERLEEKGQPVHFIAGLFGRPGEIFKSGGTREKLQRIIHEFGYDSTEQFRYEITRIGLERARDEILSKYKK